MPGAKSGAIPSTGPLSATVPAVLDACVVALDQFGTKTLAEVLQPAIELADGHPIDELRVQYIRTRASIFAQWPDAKRVFMPGGQVPKVGDIFAQPDLARTLREIVDAEQRASARGRRAALAAARDHFYKGPIGKRIGDYMQQNGGLLAAEDLARFRAKTGEPARGQYRGYEIYKAGFWTQGPVMVEALNVLSGFDLQRDGAQLRGLRPHPRRGAQARLRRPRPLLRRPRLRQSPRARAALRRVRGPAPLSDQLANAPRRSNSPATPRA